MGVQLCNEWKDLFYSSHAIKQFNLHRLIFTTCSVLLFVDVNMSSGYGLTVFYHAVHETRGACEFYLNGRQAGVKRTVLLKCTCVYQTLDCLCRGLWLGSFVSSKVTDGSGDFKRQVALQSILAGRDIRTCAGKKFLLKKFLLNVLLSHFSCYI